MLRIDKRFLKRFMRFFTLNEQNPMDIIVFKDLFNKNNIEYWMDVLKFVKIWIASLWARKAFTLNIKMKVNVI